MITNQQSGTSVDEIGDGIFRISTPVPPEAIPGGFTLNQFTQGGHEHQPLTSEDILHSSEATREVFNYFCETRHVQEFAEKLASTSPHILACMHGAAWKGNGGNLLRELGTRLAG
ncbi:MAG: hypothetical protein ACC628_11140 [Pirellulaceae bacterium]